MTPAELRAEILADPKGLGYAALLGRVVPHPNPTRVVDATATVAAPDDQGVADLLSTPSVAHSCRTQPVARRDIKQALIAKLGAILASTDPAAAPVKLLFSDPDFPSVNTDSPAWAAVRDPLLAAGLIDAADAAAVAALADRTPASRAEELWGAGAAVSAQQVGNARNLVGE
jgi:hypothetical protein